ncbi:hypothetical protein JZ785_20065 [Alicyclobacillus curvatus]|nr:hypothetical protein JZ785_20065 [Alicyclobacillus curvatus]
MYFGSYASVLNQAYHLAHYLLAFLLAYFFIPQLMFKPVEGTRMDNYFANFLRMVLFVIVLGYLLIITKLLEFIGFGASIITWILLMRGKERGGNKSLTIVVALFYDLIETPYLIRQALGKAYRWLKFRRNTGEKSRVKQWAASLLHGVRRLLTPNIIYPLLLLVVLGVSIYLRWTDAVVNAAPPMSDGVVILAWVKYVNLRILFHDGIYPQGYFISDDFISKFAFINPLYIVKYSGAMATTLIVASMYYVASRMGRKVEAAGIIAALVYGIFGYTLLQNEWARQAAMETQEFGFAFALPTIYFAYRYFSSGVKRNLTVTFAGLTVSGLIHVLSYMLTLIGCISVLIAFLILDERKQWGRYAAASLIGVASGLISLAPLELGKLFHRSLNGPAAAFASQTVPTPAATTAGATSSAASTAGSAAASSGPLAVPLPPLDPMSKVALAAILLLIVGALIARLRGRRESAWLSGGLFGLFMFAIYYLGGPITRSYVIQSRSVDIWAVAAAFCIGFALQTFAVSPFARSTSRLQAVARDASGQGMSGRDASGRGMAGGMPGRGLPGHGLPTRKLGLRPWLQALEKVSLMGIVIVPQVMLPPKPIIPYKMEWNVDAEQYLRIEQQYKASGYMLVAPDAQYALVLGTGYLMSPTDFVNFYDPALRPLTRYGKKKPDTNIAPNVFIYYYKHIFELPKSETIAYNYELPVYQQEYYDRAKLAQWLTLYQQHHGPVTVYYSGPDLIIYYIRNEVTDSSSPVPSKK